MKELNLYKIEQEYLYYLAQFDPAVSIKGNRPFVAVCLELANTKYAIPLTSKCFRANGKRRNVETTTELIGKNGFVYGAILHNNMIPVNDSVVSPIIFNNENAKDKRELMAKYKLIKSMASSIRSKSNNVYKKRITATSPFFNKFCCDFKLLEQKLCEYTEIKNISNDLSLNEVATTRENATSTQQQTKLSLSERLSAARAKADKLNKQNHTENLHKNPNNVNLE